MRISKSRVVSRILKEWADERPLDEIAQDLNLDIDVVARIIELSFTPGHSIDEYAAILE